MRLASSVCNVNDYINTGVNKWCNRGEIVSSCFETNLVTQLHEVAAGLRVCSERAWRYRHDRDGRKPTDIASSRRTSGSLMACAVSKTPR